MGGMMGTGWWWMLVWSLVGLAILIAAIAAVVWLTRQAPAGATRHSAEDVLRRRYAAGEIGRDEFMQRLQDLRNQ